MAVENNTNLRKKTKLDKNWCSAKSADQIYISGMDCKKHQNRINGYIGYTENKFYKILVISVKSWLSIGLYRLYRLNIDLLRFIS